MSQIRRWPWIAQQEWRHVLFLHWSVPYEELRPYIPTPFELETFDGRAWVSVILFQAKNSRLRGMPSSLSYSPFLQVNVRTYITFNGEPGIYFFSIDANRFFAVNGAKYVLGLPYQQAEIKLTQDKKSLLFESKRIEKGNSSLGISANYQPSTTVIPNDNNTLSYWLTERYCFWMIKGNKIIKGPLSHAPWKLQAVTVDLNMSELVPFISAPYSKTDPLVHYATSINAHLHPFEQKGIYIK